MYLSDISFSVWLHWLLYGSKIHYNGRTYYTYAQKSKMMQNTIKPIPSRVHGCQHHQNTIKVKYGGTFKDTQN